MAHVASLSAVVFSTDGHTLYSGSTDGALHGWDAESGTHQRELVGHERSVLHLGVTPRGALVSASRDGTIRVWPNESSTPEHTLRHHTGGVYAVSVDEHGITSCSHDRTIHMAGRVLRGHRDTVTGIVRCGDALVSGSRDNTLRRWDPTTGREVASRSAHDRWVTQLRTAGANACVSASEDGTVACWDAPSLELRWKRPVHATRPPVWGLDVSHDGTLAVTGSPMGGQLWRVADGTMLRALPQPPLANRACAFSRDARLLALGCDDGSLSVFETATGRLCWRSAGNALGALSAAASPDGSLVAIGFANGRIEVRDRADAVIRSFQGHERFVYLLRGVDAGRFLSGGFDGWMNVWSYDGEPLRRFHHGGGFVFGAAICREADCVVSSGGDSARVWRFGSDVPLAVLPIQSEGVHNFVSADDAATSIVTGNEAGVLDVWRRNGASYRKTHAIALELGTDQLCALTRAADGTLLAGTAGGTLVVADPRTERVVARYPCHEDWIRELRVARNGAVMALAQDTSFELVRLTDGERISTSPPKTRVAAVAQLDDGAMATVDLIGRVRWCAPLP
jgi:WD40 repeat protein